MNPGEAALLLTEPYFNLPNIQDVYDQFVFEEYEFQSCVRAARTFIHALPHCLLASASHGVARLPWTAAHESLLQPRRSSRLAACSQRQASLNQNAWLSSTVGKHCVSFTRDKLHSMLKTSFLPSHTGSALPTSCPFSMVR